MPCNRNTHGGFKNIASFPTGMPIIMLGTPNGVREAGRASVHLAKRYNVRCIVLEAPQAHATEVRAYQRGALSLHDLRLVSPRPPHDGRRGSWLKPLLRHAKRQKVSVRFLDVTSTDPNERERLIATRLRRINVGPVLVVCGELHATTQVVRLPMLARLTFALINRDLRAATPWILPAAARLNGRCVAYRLVARYGGYQYNFLRRHVPRQYVTEQPTLTVREFHPAT